MNKAARTFTFSLILLAGNAIAGVTSNPHANTIQGTHLVDQACDSCHLTGAQGAASNNWSALVASQETVCSDCHVNATRASHPTGFVPNRPLPEAFPLNKNGEMTCSTCHDTHGENQGLLRTAARGKEVCESCHDDKFFESMADTGFSLFLSGHIDARTDSGLDSMDSFSLQCLGCHEDRLSDQNMSVQGHMDANNHPVGVDYNRNAVYGGYKPLATVSETIMLPDQKISCVSCHEGYSKEHGKIVAFNQTTGLCNTCHDL